MPSFSGATNNNSVRESSSLVTSITSTNSSISSTHSGNTLVLGGGGGSGSVPVTKSGSSQSGVELDASLPSSVTQQQLKRTYCYAVVHAKTKMITFYCFTTESSSYDSIRTLLDQAADLIQQRYHLVSNTVLYKLGGLIGPSLLYDLKRVKAASLAACFAGVASQVAQKFVFISLMLHIDDNIIFNSQAYFCHAHYLNVQTRRRGRLYRGT